MPLVNTGLLVRYWLNEAASGSTPTDVLDGSGISPAFNLPIEYDSGNLAWTEVATGRGLVSSSTTGDQRCTAVLGSGDKLWDNLFGSQQAVLEVVVDVDNFSPSTGRIITINVDDGSSPRLGIVGTGPTTWQFWMTTTQNGTLLMRTWDGPETRHVLHVVVDTTQATANDRILVLIDGSVIAPTVNANPSQNATLDLGVDDGSSALFLFNRESGGVYNRSIDGAIYYAAIYTAMSVSDALNNATDLLQDDDEPLPGPVVIQPGNRSARYRGRDRRLRFVS